MDREKKSQAANTIINSLIPIESLLNDKNLWNGAKSRCTETYFPIWILVVRFLILFGT